MSGLKWELPMWSRKYGQAVKFEPTDIGFKVVFHDDYWNYHTDGTWRGGREMEDRRLHNGVMPNDKNPAMPEPDEQYVTVDSDGMVTPWNDLEGAQDDQRRTGGVIIDLTKVSSEAFVQPTKERTIWLNIYDEMRGDVPRIHFRCTRQDADANADANRIACVAVTFKSGDGLDNQR